MCMRYICDVWVPLSALEDRVTLLLHHACLCVAPVPVLILAPSPHHPTSLTRRPPAVEAVERPLLGQSLLPPTFYTQRSLEFPITTAPNNPGNHNLDP
jgi:hypothetical protein